MTEIGWKTRCTFCEKPFRARSVKAKYCSNACKQAAWRFRQQEAAVEDYARDAPELRRRLRALRKAIERKEANRRRRDRRRKRQTSAPIPWLEE